MQCTIGGAVTFVDFRKKERHYICSEFSNKGLIHLEGFVSEVIFYRYLIDNVCPPPDIKNGEHYILLFPYKTRTLSFNQIKWINDHRICLKEIDIKFLEYVLKEFRLIKNRTDSHRVINQLLSGNIYSDFIPLLPCRSASIYTLMKGIRVDLQTDKGEYEYNIHSLISNLEKALKDETIITNFDYYAELFKIIIESRYRPDVICLYFIESSKKKSLSVQYGGISRHRKVLIKKCRPKKAIIIEVKSSDPEFSRSYTSSQRAFIKRFLKVSKSYGDLYKYIIVYLPLTTVIKNLWYEVYYL